MAKWISNRELQKMSYNEIGKALTSGRLSEKRLRSYYTEARKKANDRLKRVSSEKVTNEFGNEPEEHFSKLKNLTTTAALAHAVADANRWLNSKQSTITGLKQQREQYINTAQSRGIDIDESNFADWIRFIRWFKNSEFAYMYDSDSEEVQEAFQNSESATPSDWKNAFKTFLNADNENSNIAFRERR